MTMLSQSGIAQELLQSYEAAGILEYPFISFHAPMENFVVMSNALESATLFTVQKKVSTWIHFIALGARIWKTVET